VPFKAWFLVLSKSGCCRCDISRCHAC